MSDWAPDLAVLSSEETPSGSTARPLSSPWQLRISNYSSALSHPLTFGGGQLGHCSGQNPGAGDGAPSYFRSLPLEAHVCCWPKMDSNHNPTSLGYILTDVGIKKWIYSFYWDHRVGTRCILHECSGQTLNITHHLSQHFVTRAARISPLID